MTGSAQTRRRSDLADGPSVEPADTHRGPAQRPGIDDEEPDQADVDDRLDGDRDAARRAGHRAATPRSVERDADDEHEPAARSGCEAREDEERRRARGTAGGRGPAARSLRAGAGDEPDGQRDEADDEQDRGRALDWRDRSATAIDPPPRSVASQPTTNSAGAERPSIVNVEARRPDRGVGGPPGRRRVARRMRSGDGRGLVRPSTSGTPRAADRAGSTLGQRILAAAGSGPVAVTRRRAAADGIGRARLDAAASAARRAAIRPVASRSGGSASIARRPATSRRSKSLPHQAHSDQSMPTRRLQFGQTRFSRVRQFGQMIHSSSIRRSQPGQWWIDSTSARRASSARFRSQTSPIFSCGRMIL